jgi:hypothetical protein
VKGLVAEQVAGIIDADLREAAMGWLIEPVLHDVPWDYGREHETFPCWIVADLRPSVPYVVAYCEHGFGPDDPFGVIDGDLSSMGMDAQWFKSLEPALRCIAWPRRGER